MLRLNAGKTHASLGPKLKPGSAERAQRTLDRLVERGLQPEDTFIDYGCGTLRVGALLINYLAPDRYIGLDIDQRLLDLGREMLSAEVTSEKRPTLRVISPETIDEVAARRPDWIFSNGVVQHISPEDLKVYFANMRTLATTQTKICIKVSKLEEKSARKSPNTWFHSLVEVEGAAKLAGLFVQNFTSTSGGTGGWLVLQTEEGQHLTTSDTSASIQGKLT
ncbi:MAG: class I SAM-dependent methyltransferase [Bauldia sp.]|nr:class I SAM-dependent methyltransferase [Bauldia sp.]